MFSSWPFFKLAASAEFTFIINKTQFPPFCKLEANKNIFAQSSSSLIICLQHPAWTSDYFSLYLSKTIVSTSVLLCVYISCVRTVVRENKQDVLNRCRPCFWYNAAGLVRFCFHTLFSPTPASTKQCINKINTSIYAPNDNILFLKYQNIKRILHFLIYLSFQGRFWREALKNSQSVVKYCIVHMPSPKAMRSVH